MAASIVEFFLENFQLHRRDCAYRQRRGYRTESFTYQQVLQLAIGFASELERRGISKGDRVMLWGENSAEWAAVFFGCALSGVVVVPMDDGAAADFVRRVCGQVGTKLVVASGKHREEVGDLGVPVIGLEELAHVRQQPGHGGSPGPG